MNYQTRRDLAYLRNMQEWLDLYVKLERETIAFYAKHEHIQSDADFTPETRAAFDADNDALCANHGPFYAQGMRELGSDMEHRIRKEARELIKIQDAHEETNSMQYQYHPSHDAVVTAGDIRADRNHANAEAYADLPADIVDGTYRSNLSEGPDFTISLIQHDQYWIENVAGYVTTVSGAEARELVALGHWELISEDTTATVWTCDSQGTSHKEEVAPAWNARLAARAASIVTAAGGLALAIACLTGTPASAHTLPLVPTDGECVLTHQFEDGSATALCGPNDAWAYDADGNNPPASVGYTGPTWAAGWYPCIDASCAVIDHTH